jgi:nucleotide-binding universal stress UspA family protein
MLTQPTIVSLRRDLSRALANPLLLGSATSVGHRRPRRIVCPVSLRKENANWAVQIAYLLAQEHVAELVLVHSSDKCTANELAETDQLCHLQEQLPGVNTKTLTVWGDPASAIVRASAEADLVVMRPSQPSWLVGRLVDSLSQRVCRLAHCPVVLIHQENGRHNEAPQGRSAARKGLLRRTIPRLAQGRMKAPALPQPRD